MNLISLSNFELARIIFALVCLLGLAHAVGYLFHRLHLPRVVGEISAGILLGPSCLGYLAPEAYNWLFNAFPEEGKLLSLLYWLGLIFLMFISGFEIKETVHKKDMKVVASIILGATIIPFLAGWLVPSFYDFTPYIGVKNNFLSMQIVIAIAVAVTSIPVISKIFIDLNITGTRFSNIVLSAATIQDIFLWVALAVATGLVSSASVSASNIAIKVAITLAFFTITFFLTPKILGFLNTYRFNLIKRSSTLTYILVICFLFSGVASVLDVNIVFGAFIAGVVIGLNKNEDFNKEKKYIKEIGVSFLIPIYFAIVGLKLDLIQHFDLGFFLFFLCFSTFFEAIGVMLATKFTGQSWLSSFNFSVAMNTRGGPGIVLATVAYDLGIINEVFFVTLVLTAIITSLLAGWWFKYLLQNNIPLLKN